MSWGCGGGKGGMQAPVASNPFAAAPPMAAVGLQPGMQAPGGGPSNDSQFTGPMLGKGSELQRTYSVPQGSGHEMCVNKLIMCDDKVYSAGRDEYLFIWRGDTNAPQPGGGFQLVRDTPNPIHLQSAVTALHYDPSTKWLFCGLWSGDIKAYCKEPAVEDRLAGHRRSVADLTVHSNVVVSGSNDGSVRLWTMNPQAGRFQCFGQPLNNPTGAITSVKVLNDGIWVGAQNGITCFDLATLQPRGTIPSNHQVTGLVEFQNHMVATYRDGSVKIFDSKGSEAFNRPSQGEHTSNTAVEVMMHPIENKPMLLCGQQYGYVTAYDLPDFRPRGSFVCKHNSDVKSIMDCKANGMFMTGGMHGDITVWQWGQATGGGGMGGGATPVAASPFAAAGAAPGMAASPFGQPQGVGGGMGGGMMM